MAFAINKKTDFQTKNLFFCFDKMKAKVLLSLILSIGRRLKPKANQS